MSASHFVVFPNLRCSQTGETIRLSISNSRVYEGKRMLTGLHASHLAKETLRRIHRVAKPKEGER